jgi:sortase (surface protein transpeptidase)
MAGRQYGAAVLFTGAALLVVAGYLVWPDSAAGPVRDSGTVPPITATRPDADRRDGPATPGHRPRQLQVPSLGVNARVAPVATQNNGLLAVPERPDRLGWWRHGARAGGSAGTVVIVGHVDSARYGRGAFFELRLVQLGAGIRVETTGGPVSYVVTAVRRYPKSDLPAEVFARDGIHRLVLVTCGGDFDNQTRQYEDNLAVYAVPAPEAQ